MGLTEVSVQPQQLRALLFFSSFFCKRYYEVHFHSTCSQYHGIPVNSKKVIFMFSLAAIKHKREECKQDMP